MKMINYKHKPGFTLLELLVAVTIFAMASIISILTVFQINNLSIQNQEKQNLQAEAQNAAQFIQDVSRGATDIEYGHIDCFGLVSYRPSYNCTANNPLFVKPSLTPGSPKDIFWDAVMTFTDGHYPGAITSMSFTSPNGLMYYILNQYGALRVLIYDPVNKVKEVHNLISNEFALISPSVATMPYEPFHAQDDAGRYDQASLEVNHYLLPSMDLFFTIQSRDNFSLDQLLWASQTMDTPTGTVVTNTDWQTQSVSTNINRYQSAQNINHEKLRYPVRIHLGK